MTTKWNWQKICNNGSKKLNLPDFDKPVLLLDKQKDRSYAIVGYLKSLDASGPHWSTPSNMFSLLFAGMFDSMDLKTPENFIPSHWCRIEVPEDEKPEDNG